MIMALTALPRGWGLGEGSNQRYFRHHFIFNCFPNKTILTEQMRVSPNFFFLFDLSLFDLQPLALAWPEVDEPETREI